MIPRVMSELKTDGTAMRLIACIAFTVIEVNAKHFVVIQFYQKNLMHVTSKSISFMDVRTYLVYPTLLSLQIQSNCLLSNRVLQDVIIATSIIQPFYCPIGLIVFTLKRIFRGLYSGYHSSKSS
jgi:hypothetical protein